ncbi:hypothetical protein BW731_07870 [Vagococcus martis]|uniref:SGNH hydrolase-type esterase domain-containing protein n=1 Tax=Vagococcus martis TaxID=1768210 RepID=A0A1V4DI32_9ENTE|nr:SGNH/GDSL hydrolase family protein [Vagococcus martis]OPF88091.1 hypothetical protein BW731_07870 [Vagococcus martis]
MKKKIMLAILSLIVLCGVALIYLYKSNAGIAVKDNVIDIQKEKVDVKQVTKEKDSNRPKVIVNFGDSIFGNTGETSEDTSISAELTKITPNKYINAAFGNTMASTRQDYMYWDSLSLVSLVNEVVKDDSDISKWNTQDASISAGVFPDKFADQLDKIKKIDFFDVDEITIGFGTNDFTKEASLFGTDVHSYSYALDNSIKKLKKEYPDIKITVISPAYRYWKNPDGTFLEDSNTREVNGYKLTDFVEESKKIAKENDVTFINNYDVINFDNKEQYFDEFDSTHQNVEGRRFLAKYLAEQMK